METVRVIHNPENNIESGNELLVFLDNLDWIKNGPFVYSDLPDVESSDNTSTLKVLSTYTGNDIQWRTIPDTTYLNLEEKIGEADKLITNINSALLKVETITPDLLVESISNANEATTAANQATEAANQAVQDANTAAEAANQAAQGIDAKIATKQDTLVSGENIKTVNGMAVLGEGNIVINPTIMDLQWTNNVATTRKLVPAELRKKGVKIAYRDNSGVYHVEQYQAEDIDDESWENDANWKGCRTPNTPMFENLYGISFNDETGFYEFHVTEPYEFSITDLTEDDMITTYSASLRMSGTVSYASIFYYDGFNSVKARLVLSMRQWSIGITSISAFCYSANIETIYLGSRFRLLSTTSISNAFDSGSLVNVLGTFEADNITAFPANMFAHAIKLQRIYMKKVKANLDISVTPVLLLETLSYLIENAANTAAITITVHPDVYAKLTDEANAEWYAVNTAAQAKNISFATTE